MGTKWRRETQYEKWATADMYRRERDPRKKNDQKQKHIWKPQYPWMLKESRNWFKRSSGGHKEKAERISQRTCSYGLSKTTTRLAYTSVYLPTIQYPWASSHIPRRTLQRIQAKATRRFLACMGFNPTLPRIVVYAPRQMGGLGMQWLHTTQGVNHFMLMLKHLRAMTTLGKLFLIGID